MKEFKLPVLAFLYINHKGYGCDCVVAVDLCQMCTDKEEV